MNAESQAQIVTPPVNTESQAQIVTPPMNTESQAQITAKVTTPVNTESQAQITAKVTTPVNAGKKNPLIEALVSNSARGTVHKTDSQKNPDRFFPERLKVISIQKNPDRLFPERLKVISIPSKSSINIKEKSTKPLLEYAQSLGTFSLDYFQNARLSHEPSSKVKFCVVMPGYNVDKYITQSINSVFIQSYHNWQLVVINDMSTDNTSQILTEIQEHSGLQPSKFNVITHTIKMSSASYSFYEASHHYCDQESVIVFLDADDLLANHNTLENIASIYQNNKNIWVTFGSYTVFNQTHQIETNLDFFNLNFNSNDLNNIRSRPWVTSHLKTAYNWLFQKIDPKDLKIQDNFITAANDIAMMLPLIEMAGPNRVHPIKEVTCLYRVHESSTHNDRRELQIANEKYFKSLPRYQTLPNNYNLALSDRIPKLSFSSSKSEIKNFDDTLASYRFNKLPNFENSLNSIKFCIVIPSYNNENYVYQNLNSIFMQDYKTWRIVYVNDHSSDNTLSIVRQIKLETNSSDERLVIIDNDQRYQSPAYSYYHAAHKYCQDQEVLVQLDADDMLASPEVLTSLVNTYSNPNIWLTFGSLIDTDGNRRIILEKYNLDQMMMNPRSNDWFATHLRTSYTWLFKKIKIEDLKLQGEFYKTTADLAIMYPLIEMATKNHIAPIYDLKLVYRLHDKNDHAVNRNLQIEAENQIKSKPPYIAIEEYKDGCLSDANLYQTNMPDQVYVINLDQASSRWEAISSRLTCAGMKYTKFPATYGLKIKITNLQTQSEFYGKDIKDGKVKLQNKLHYKITCNPDDPTSAEFHYTAHLNHKHTSLSAGELGIYCSVLRVLHDARSNGYNNIIIFEDDIVPTATFKKDLSHFIYNLPSDYDLAYLDYYLSTKDQKVIYNEYVHGFTNQAAGWGAYAYMLSSDGINSLIHLIENNATYAIDNFYWCVATGIAHLEHHPKTECDDFANSLQTFGSSQHLVDVLRLDDETSIDAQGRYV